MSSTKGEGKILLHREGKVATIQVHRPERKNALTHEMVRELTKTLEELRGSTDVAAVIITGTGDAFMSGFDVGRVTSQVGEMAPSQWRELRDLGARQFEALYEMGKPTIAAINGSCVVGGISTALACDIRIASEAARFRIGFRRMALMPSPDICFLLPLLVGLGRAKLLAMADPFFDAHEAQRIGLVEEVVPGDQLMHRALQLANDLASGPLLMFAATKEAMNRAYGLDLRTLRRAIDNAQFVLTRTQDHKEAIKAFAEKREPRFTGQ